MIPYDIGLVEAIRTAIPALNIHAWEGLPEEIVGLILSDGDIVRLINQARSSSRFEISRRQMAEKLAYVDPEKHSVVAIYHSHPSGTTTLSPTDLESMSLSWKVDRLTIPWVVVCPGSRVGIWWLDPTYRQPQSQIIQMEKTELASVV